VSERRAPIGAEDAAFGGGKIILLGEHAVVHGKPAIAAGIARGVRARARALGPGDPGGDRLRVSPWGVDVGPARAGAARDGAPRDGAAGDAVAGDGAAGDAAARDGAAGDGLARAFAALLDALDADRAAAGLPPRPRLRVDAEVGLPGGAGLGCSAALGVAVVRALDAATGTPRDEAGVVARSLDWERVFHGTPSGIDNTVAARGGLVWFSRGEGGLRVEPLVPRTPLRLVVADTGLPGATRETVASVRRQLERAPERTQKTLDAIETVVRNGRVAIEGGDLRGLGQLLDMNQWLLASLLVSTPELEALCASARAAGALGAKLTGGGGGGCMIALAEDEAHAEHLAIVLGGRAREAFVVTVGRAAGRGEGKGAGR
jgi:mevalonate kinase